LDCCDWAGALYKPKHNAVREPTRDKHIIPRDVAVKSWLEMKKRIEGKDETTEKREREVRWE
jgi:hypothetical protein